MLKIINESAELLKKSFYKLFLFELVYTIMTLFILVPFLGFLMNMAIKLANIQYLTSYNIVRFVKSPATWIFLGFLIFFYVIYMWFEICAVIHCFSNTKQDKEVTFGGMIHAGIEGIFKIFKPKNLLTIVYVLLLIPLVNVLFVSGFFGYIGIPDFLSYYITHKQSIIYFYILLFAVSAIFSSKWIFSPFETVILKYSFNTAQKRSRYMARKKAIKTIFTLILWDFVGFGLIFLIMNIFFAVPILLINILTDGTGGISKISLISIKLIFRVLMILMSIFSVPFTFSCLTTMYFDTREKMHLPKLHESNDVAGFEIKKQWIRRFLVSLSAFLVVFYALFFTGGGFSLYNIKLFSTPTISAHRGNSSANPENTVYSFESAINCGADYIELDVQETKDSQVVVMHDSSLLRTAGVAKNIWEVDYDEIKDLDIGSWFSPEFADARIMTLEEVLELTKGRIKLNIEIKPTGNEKNLTENTVRLIEEYGFEDDCYVTSFSYDVIKEVKGLNPDIKTGLIMTIAYGNVAGLEYADALSVNRLFVTKRLVSSCHNNGKKVFAWTVDKSADMQTLAELNVDNIITDYPETAIKTSYSVYTGKTLLSIYKYLAN
jgi:glycerophosphoryl diester phosphodiesterase